MGVKGFSEVFENEGEIKYKDLTNKNVCIDASVEIYRSALGMAASKVLTDSNGTPTSHINTLLLGVILKLKAAGVNQWWVFDYNQKASNIEQYHNPLKELELNKRKITKQKASDKLKILKENMEKLNVEASDNENVLFSDSDSELSDDTIKKSVKEKLMQKKEMQSKIDTQQKASFKLEDFYTKDLLMMLDLLDIPWIESPAGFEAEQICALATKNDNILNTKIDYVFTTDVDTLLFGAKKLIKRDTRKKKLFLYDLKNILTDNELTQDDLIKIGLILGTDFANKTPRVGPKTVLKKFRYIELTTNQKDAIELIFKKELSKSDINNIIIHNVNNKPFTDKKKYEDLLFWLETKNYNRERINKQFSKQKLFQNAE
jgi:flap endonuclease-1